MRPAAEVAVAVTEDVGAEAVREAELPAALLEAEDARARAELAPKKSAPRARSGGARRKPNEQCACGSGKKVKKCCGVKP